MNKYLRTVALVSVWSLIPIWILLLGIMARVRLDIKDSDMKTSVIWEIFGMPMFTTWREGSVVGSELHWGALTLLVVPLVVGMAAATTRAIIWRKDRHGRASRRSGGDQHE